MPARLITKAQYLSIMGGFRYSVQMFAVRDSLSDFVFASSLLRSTVIMSLNRL
jgi:hypothetical protein